MGSNITGRKARVLVVGAGGVGTMACVALERSGKAKVTAVLRSNYKQVKSQGFEIDSVDHGRLPGWRPSEIVPSVPQADPANAYDYIVVTMKDVPEVSSLPDVIRPAVSKDGATAIVLIQNGIGIEQQYINEFPQTIVLSGVSMISAHELNGSVVHYDHDEIALGVFHNAAYSKENEAQRAAEFASMYDSTSADCKVVPDIVLMRWRKLMWNGIFNPLCAITQLDSAAIRYFGGEHSLIRPAMAEMAAIAQADGYALPADVVDMMIESTPIETAFRPSMLADVDKGSPMEAEVILGNPLRIARKRGVVTPILDHTYRMLRLVQARLLAASGRLQKPSTIPTEDFI